MLVVDRLLYRARDNEEPLSLVDEAIEGGVTLVQLRLSINDGPMGSTAMPSRSDCARLPRARPVRRDQRPRSREKSAADGVLLTGERTYRPTAAREYLRGPQAWLAATLPPSLRRRANARRRLCSGRAIFATADYGEAVDEGLPLIRKIKDAIHLPIIAFGGIDTVERAALAVQAGADGIAVSHNLLSAPDPRATAAALRSAMSA